MKLVDVYSLGYGLSDWPGDWARAVGLLYDLLGERPLEHGISHRAMPSFHEHVEFVDSKPFRYWLLIEHGAYVIGAIECLPTNEFGIHLFKAHQGQGLGREAVELFLSTHEPLPAIPAVRNGHWLANCSQNNTGAIAFFEKLGFHEIQRTFELEKT